MEALLARGRRLRALIRRRRREERDRRDGKNERSARPDSRAKAVHVGEIYGFVGAITTSVFAAVYFFWAYTPERVLHALGIHYYPSKYWALALPVWLSALAVSAFFAYEAYNLAASPPLHSVLQVRDEHSRFRADLTAEQRKMPVLYDIPLAEVNERIFGNGGGDGGGGAGKRRRWRITVS